MRLIKVGAAALNQTPFDWDGNSRNIAAAVEDARRKHVSVLCLPELCLTGYGCEDEFQSPGLQETALRVLQELAPSCRGIVTAVGLPLFFEGALYNSVCLLVDGQISGFVCKQFLANQGIHYETRWFKPWPAGRILTFVRSGSSYPLGDLRFSVGGLRLAFEICEDAWAPNRPGIRHASCGVDLILNPSASHFAFGKFEVRKRFVLEGSRAFACSYLYANLLGNESGRAIYDGGELIASNGALIAAGQRLGFGDYHLSSALIDLDATRQARAKGPQMEGDREGRNSPVSVDFEIPPAAFEAPAELKEDWETSPNLKEEEFARAESLALFDYCRKSHSSGFVVSVSGGADSSAVACLVRIMVELCLRDLGVAGFIKKFSCSPGLTMDMTADQIVSQILTCAYQGTKNSSDTTRHAARLVCSAIGATYYELEVEDLVQRYVSAVESALTRKLTWEQDDLALQNIQARARGPLVWLLANIKKALLLSTSNRSEAAVGYATMDGDTCGGLSPIAGVDKAFIRRWLCWLEKSGPRDLHPIPELSAVNTQQPAAELRPQQAQQTDEKDLMPYELLDIIERYAIRDKRTPQEIYDLVRVQFSSYSSGQLLEWVERFFRLWCRNQWKRERYAPSFHLDDENLDPKTWCRFPILSGGFHRELRELKG